MAVSKYININGDNSITHQWCYAYNRSYKDILGYQERYDLAYTKIVAEVPAALDGPVPIGGYWTADPPGITKLVSSGTTTDSNIFQLTYVPFNPSVKVFINGIQVEITLLLNPGVFRVELPQEDGYMWVEYVVTPNEASKVLGDTRNTLQSAGGIKAEVVYPRAILDTLVRQRRIINNMEAYLGITPTTWIGGRTNTLRSGPSNLIEHVTPIYAEHILELQTAIRKVEDMFDAMIPIALPRYYFSEIDYSDVYMIKYVEEIMESIHNMERIILDPTYYGG